VLVLVPMHPAAAAATTTRTNVESDKFLAANYAA